MKPMVLGFGFWLFYRKLGDQSEMFSIFGYKEKDFKPLMRTFWVSKPAHEKLSGFFWKWVSLSRLTRLVTFVVSP
jgi:hypothetical protein